MGALSRISAHCLPVPRSLPQSGNDGLAGCGYVVFRNAELASRAMEQRQWRINGDDITVKPCSDVRITRNLTANRFETIRDELPEGLPLNANLRSSALMPFV